MQSELRITFLSFPGCPNAGLTRDTLDKALIELGLVKAEVEEYNLMSEACPEVHLNWPSPTILVNGRDIEDSTPADNPACRIYPGPNGAPSLELIKKALLSG